MENVFLHLVNMSITAGWLVLAVLVLRLVFRRAPKWIHCLLWVLVALRLIFPVSIESVVSLVPSTETVPVDTFLYETPSINSGVPVVDNTVNPIISESFAPQPTASVNPMQVVTAVAAYLWIAGVVAMVLYALITTARLWWRVRESVSLRDNIRLCDRIATPFILGLFRPRIYLPTTLAEEDMQCVVAHEQAHLRRRDHWWKPLGFLLLAVYWFNPLLWVGYVLLCRDIEAACDEKVIRHMDVAQRKAYSETLLACSAPRHLITACPLAFGETGVKSRIKSVLNYKKPAFWIIIAAVVATVVAAVCLLTNPKVNDVPEDLDAYLTQVILEQNRSEHTGDAFATEAHTVFGTEEKDGKTVVYSLVLYQEYVLDENGDLKEQGGGHIPTVITVDMEGNSYALVEYWTPRDGDLYAPDIRDKYPLRYQAQALDLNRYYDGHHEKNLAAARAHFAMAELPDESEYETYAYVGPPSAQLSLQRDGNEATFTPSYYSSRVTQGTYERNEKQVIFTTDDIKLVFRVDGNSLIFDKTASWCNKSQIHYDGYYLEDGARFETIENGRRSVPFTVNHTFSVPTIRDIGLHPLYEGVPSGSYVPIIPISSVEDLDAFINKYKTDLKLARAEGDGLMPSHVMKDAYNEAYFDDNVLLIVFNQDSSNTKYSQISEIQLMEQNTKLAALVSYYYTRVFDEEKEDEGAAWLMLAEVKRSDIPKVTEYYAYREGSVPLDYYIAHYLHPMPAGTEINPLDRHNLESEVMAPLKKIVESAKWYADSALEKTTRYLAYFCVDDGVRYYYDMPNGRIYNGEKFADLTKQQAEYLKEEVGDWVPGRYTYATVTGTVTAYDKVNTCAEMQVTESSQKEMIGKTIKVYMYGTYGMWNGQTPTVGKTISVGYDGWVEDGMIYSLTFSPNLGTDKDYINDLMTTISGKVTSVSKGGVDAGTMFMDLFDGGEVRIELTSFPYLNPQVGDEYVVTGYYLGMEWVPPSFEAITITPVSSTPTVSTTTSTATTTEETTTSTVDDIGHEELAYLAAKVRVQRPADAGSTGGSVTGRIVRSVAELKTAKLDALIPYDENETFTLDYYDEAYFKHNALVVSYVTLSSGSYYLSPIYLTRSNNRLVFHYQQIQYTKMMTQDMAYYCVLYEMYQQDVEGINSVIGNGTEWKQDKLSLNPNYSISQARAILLSRLPKESFKRYVAYQGTQSDFDDGNTYYCFQVYSLSAQPMELDGKQYYQQFTYAWAYVDVHTGKLYREDAAMNLIPWDKDQSTVTTKPTTTKPTTTKKTVTTTTEETTTSATTEESTTEVTTTTTTIRTVNLTTQSSVQQPHNGTTTTAKRSTTTTKNPTTTKPTTATKKTTTTTKNPTTTKPTTTTKKTTVTTNVTSERSIEVTVADKVRVDDGYGKNSIVRTVKECNNIEKDQTIPDKAKAILSSGQYNTFYFNKNALVMTQIVLSSGSYRFDVDSVTVRGDTLTVYYSKTIPDNDGTADVAIWYVWLEVKSADVEGVKKITSVDTGKTRILRQPKVDSKELAALDTNLEFWITEDVNNVDFSKYTINPVWFGAEEYYGTGYAPVNGKEPESCVKYLVSCYPDYSDNSLHITYITITDPSIHFYGVSLKSSNAEFVRLLEKQGYVVKTVNDATNYVSMKKGNITIWRSGDCIRIDAEVTNREGILF